MVCICFQGIFDDRSSILPHWQNLDDKVLYEKAEKGSQRSVSGPRNGLTRSRWAGARVRDHRQGAKE